MLRCSSCRSVPARSNPARWNRQRERRISEFALRLSANVIQTGTKNLGSLLIRVVEASSIHRGALLLRNVLVGRGPGCVPAFRVRSRHLAKTESHLAAAHIGVVRITAASGGEASASLEQRRAAAAREAKDGPALARAPGSSGHRASLTPCGGRRRRSIAAVGCHRAALRVIRTV